MAMLLRFLSYLKAYPAVLVVMFGAMLGSLAGGLTTPRVLSLVVDRGIGQGSMPAVLRYTGLLALVALARAGMRYAQAYSQELLGQKVIHRLRHDLYQRLLRLSFGYYTMHATGDEMSKLTSDLYAVMDFVGFGVAEMVSSLLVFIGTATALLLTDWRLALVVMSPIPVLMFFAFRFSGIVGPLWERIREEMGKLTTALQENVSGVRVVKSFSREPHEIAKFGARNQANLAAHMSRATVEARTFPALNLISGFCFILLFWYGGRRVYAGQLSLGNFFAFNWYLWGLIWPVRFLGFLIGITRQALAAG
ncbi:MAG: ABC transporter ATP-binding protein, partial [Chloroflexota bacterium]